MKIKFELEEKTRANKIFLKVEYMSGDGDASEFEEIEIEGVTFDNYKEKKKEIEAFIAPYKILAEVTDVNHKNYTEDYDEVGDKFGEEVASLYDNCPGDSTCDGQVKHI